MADNRKRLLTVLKIMQDTDEQHPLTVAQIEKELKSREPGISGARKSIMEDLQVLKDCDYDIITCDDNKKGQYMRTGVLEDWQVKVLMDAVSGAKFLTETNTQELIGALANLADRSSREMLLESVPPVSMVSKTGKMKTKNHIDTILRAIREHKQIRFTYTVTGPDNEEHEKYDSPEAVHPFTLVWRDDKYYLIAMYNMNRGLSCYRLDRMKDLQVIEDAPALTLRDYYGPTAPDMLQHFIQENVYSFHGKSRLVTLRAQAKMVDVLKDHFGNVKVKDNGDGTVNAMLKIADNRGLYYFLLKYGETIQVTGPAEVREEMKTKLRAILRQYEES